MVDTLQNVGAMHVKSYDTLTAVRWDSILDKNTQQESIQRFPDAQIQQQLTIGNDTFLNTDKEITIRDPAVSTQELVAAAGSFCYLDQLVLDVSACDFDTQQLLALRRVYPGEIRCNLELFGFRFDSSVQELDFSGISMKSTDELEQMLPILQKLKKVIMCDCGFSSEEMDALSHRQPDVQFVWNVQIGRAVIRTDTTAFIPWKFGYYPTGGVSPLSDADNRLFDKDCVELKYCRDMVALDLGHMGLTDFSFLQYMPNLQYLILADNPATDYSGLQYAKNLVFLEIFMTEFDQAEVLTSLTNLRDLNLGYSTIKNWEPLTEMTWLERLWIPGAYNLTTKNGHEIKEALPNTQVIYNGAHSTDHNWRGGKYYKQMRDLLGMPHLD